MEICNRLIAVGSVICYNVSADNVSTFGNSTRIDTLVYPKGRECMERVAKVLVDTPYIVLGNGSNTLISSDGVEDIVVSPKKLNNHTIMSDGIYAEAGVNNGLLARIARDNYMTGLEFLTGIPGTLGGAIAMNAGAYGSSMSDVVEYVDVLENGEAKRVMAEDMDFGYRRNGRAGAIFVGAKLALERGNPIIISNTMKKYQLTRRRTQPTEHTLGSVFKRVNDMSAGYYIEKAGLMGYSIGGAEISTIHANFIVNKGGATSGDFVALADLARDMVYKRFGIMLEREVRYIGRGIEEVRQ